MPVDPYSTEALEMEGIGKGHEAEVDKALHEAAEESNWIVDFTDDTVVPWSSLTRKQQVKRFIIQFVKFALLLGCIYFFICDLTLLSDAFRLIAGPETASILRNSDFFNNPIASLMVGVLVTVLLQSSSTTTSIIVSMTGAGLLTVVQASFMIMGANIGTSVTGTIVALGQVGNRSQFRRAFASATAHDMFNWLTVLVM